MRLQTPNYLQRDPSVCGAKRKFVPYELEGRVVVVDQHVMIGTSTEGVPAVYYLNLT